MKYIEDLSPGDTFEYKNSIYVLTTDFKKNSDKMCVNLKTGSSIWLSGSTLTDISPVYTLDSNNSIIPIKPSEKQ